MIPPLAVANALGPDPANALKAPAVAGLINDDDDEAAWPNAEGDDPKALCCGCPNADVVAAAGGAG